MNPIVTTIVLTTLFGLFSLYYYNRYENKNKKLFRESLSRDVFFITFVAPIAAAALFTLMVSLVFREADTGKIYRSDALLFSAMFYLYGVLSVSMGMHALAKAFKDDVVRMRDVKLMRLIRYFHGPFSHIVSNVSFTMILTLLLVYNANHPIKDTLSGYEIVILIVCGVISGAGLMVTYVVSSTLRIMQYVLLMLLISASYLERSSRDILLKSPLSILVITIYSTSLALVIIDRFGPRRNWLRWEIEKRLVSVEGDWKQIVKG